MRVAVAQVGGKKAAHFGDMDPGQQVWITGCIRPAIRSTADHLQVDGAHPFDQPVGVAGRAKGGAGDELAGATQAAEHVFAEVGMVPDPGQCQWVQRLQQQGTDAADQHAREVAVYLPADAVRAEQAGIALGVFQIELAKSEAGEAHELGFDTAAEGFHGGLDVGFRSVGASCSPIASKLAPTVCR